MNEHKNGEPKVSLDPLRTHGPDSLNTNDVPGLPKPTLTGLEIRWHNKAAGITVRKADDLFATTDTEQIPKAATITKATFEIQFFDAQHPYKIAITPPNHLTIEPTAHAPLILQWLDRRHFRQAVATLLLVIASALAPALGDGDDDDDDPVTDHSSYSI